VAVRGNEQGRVLRMENAPLLFARVGLKDQPAMIGSPLVLAMPRSTASIR
jgi:hypothetical protein